MPKSLSICRPHHRAHTKIKFIWPNRRYGYGLRINSDDLLEYNLTCHQPGDMSMSLHYPEYQIDLVMLENLSLNLNDMNRVCELHSRIRQTIRSRAKRRVSYK
jgi:D-alanyl-D-alanine carboxypeptidase